ncbi:hypothetical protein WI372_11600 [Gemmatimonadota bacterium DH-20]|uniref:RiboL-PSP-HEPN domain-containing protein n=1 Tax=Gaopeijia maritima TaxID=3119007 RepID=A0ABU9EA57_9BACT
MRDEAAPNPTPLSGEEIQARVHGSLAEYMGRSVLEQYALFMGKAQMLELGLKGLLTRRFDVPADDMERWTLGKTKNALAGRGLRSDFIELLEGVVGHRNSMAHEFLVSSAITRSIAKCSGRRLHGDLFRALYEVEQIILIHDWCEENDAWLCE